MSGYEDSEPVSEPDEYEMVAEGDDSGSADEMHEQTHDEFKEITKRINTIINYEMQQQGPGEDTVPSPPVLTEYLYNLLDIVWNHIPEAQQGGELQRLYKDISADIMKSRKSIDNALTTLGEILRYNNTVHETMGHPAEQLPVNKPQPIEYADGVNPPQNSIWEKDLKAYLNTKLAEGLKIGSLHTVYR